MVDPDPEKEKAEKIKAKIRALVSHRKRGADGKLARSFLMPSSFRKDLGSRSKSGYLNMSRSLTEWEWLLDATEKVVLPLVRAEDQKAQAAQEEQKRKKGIVR